jgi:uncharacterized protein YjiS (DUF1127 family)
MNRVAPSPALPDVPARLVARGPARAGRLGPLARLLAAMALRQSRRSLADLDDHLLRDVGLSREAAQREAARPAWDALDEAPWDAPAHWLR